MENGAVYQRFDTVTRRQHALRVHPRDQSARGPLDYWVTCSPPTTAPSTSSNNVRIHRSTLIA